MSSGLAPGQKVARAAVERGTRGGRRGQLHLGRLLGEEYGDRCRRQVEAGRLGEQSTQFGARPDAALCRGHPELPFQLGRRDGGFSGAESYRSHEDSGRSADQAGGSGDGSAEPGVLDEGETGADVGHGRGDVPVARQLLDGEQVHAPLVVVCGAGPAQVVQGEPVAFGPTFQKDLVRTIEHGRPSRARARGVGCVAEPGSHRPGRGGPGGREAGHTAGALRRHGQGWCGGGPLRPKPLPPTPP